MVAIPKGGSYAEVLSAYSEAERGVSWPSAARGILSGASSHRYCSCCEPHRAYREPPVPLRFRGETFEWDRGKFRVYVESIRELVTIGRNRDGTVWDAYTGFPGGGIIASSTAQDPLTALTIIVEWYEKGGHKTL